MRFVVAGLLGASFALPQQAVPAAREPHHHAVYEDARVRIFEIQMGPGESMPAHRHEGDSVWLALSDRASGMHFSRNGESHVERGGEIIVELLQRQGNPHNVCGEVLPGEYLHCHEPGSEWLGANLQVQFETEQTRFGILQIAPNATLAVPPGDVPPLLIALGGIEAEETSRVNGAPAGGASKRKLKAVDVLRSPADHVSEIRNVGNSAARFLVVEFGGAGE